MCSFLNPSFSAAFLPVLFVFQFAVFLPFYVFFFHCMCILFFIFSQSTLFFLFFFFSKSLCKSSFLINVRKSLCCVLFYFSLFSSLLFLYPFSSFLWYSCPHQLFCNITYSLLREMTYFKDIPATRKLVILGIHFQTKM